MGHRVNYGAWWSYSFQRLGGLELGAQGLYDMPPSRSAPGRVVLTSFADRRDRLRFAAAYADPESGITTGPRPAALARLRRPAHLHRARRDPRRHRQLQGGARDGRRRRGLHDVVAPGSASRIGNRYYKTDEEFLFACADAMREEYKAIVDAGLDPAARRSGDRRELGHGQPGADGRGLPARSRWCASRRSTTRSAACREDRIRFHLCWGSWHGPHITDIPMRDIVDVMLAINAGAYSFEAGNVRHEHEWRVWQDVEAARRQDDPARRRQPRDQRRRAPGAGRRPHRALRRPASGREHVIASTDCGLGGRVHPQIAWAKLEALAEGAALASRQLWACVGSGARA